MYEVNVTIGTNPPINVRQSGAVANVPGLYLYFKSGDISAYYGDETGNNLPALDTVTLQFLQDGVEIDKQVYPQHFRWTVYRCILQPDSVINPFSVCVTNGWSMPYGKIDPSVIVPACNPATYTGAMSLAGIYPAEGSTGEREEIGFESERGARAGVVNDYAPMFQQARGADSIPFHCLDSKTGKPVNLLTRPAFSFAQNRTDSVPGPASASPFQYDDGHHPEVSALPLFISKQVRHLENLQHQVTMQLALTSFNMEILQTGYAIFGFSQVRGYGWDWRSLLKCWKATQLAEQWGLDLTNCLPSTYWKQIIDNQVAFLKKYFMNNPAAQRFRSFPNIGTYDPWQQDFVHQSMALLGLYFPDEYGDVTLWAFYNIYQRTNGQSGWPPRYQAYNCWNGPTLQDDTHGQGEFPGQSTHGNPQPIANPPAGQPPFDGKVLDIMSNLSPDWVALWNFNKSLVSWLNVTPADTATLLADPFSTNSCIFWDADASMYTHEALAAYVHVSRQGKIDFSKDYPLIEQTYATYHLMAVDLLKNAFKGQLDARFQLFVPPTGQVLPPPVVIPPPVNTPPTGGTMNPTNVQIQVGESRHLTVNLTPAGSVVANPTTFANGNESCDAVPDADGMGVTVTGRKPTGGTPYAATAHITGATQFDLVCNVTVVAVVVAPPLATAGSLDPDPVG